MQVSENHHGSVNGVAYYSGVSDQVRRVVWWGVVMCILAMFCVSCGRMCHA